MRENKPRGRPRMEDSALRAYWREHSSIYYNSKVKQCDKNVESYLWKKKR